MDSSLRSMSEFLFTNFLLTWNNCTWYIRTYIIIHSFFQIQLNTFVGDESNDDESLKTHEKDERAWETQEMEPLQDSYLNFYDTVNIILTDYEDVSTNQLIYRPIIRIQNNTI